MLTGGHWILATQEGAEWQMSGLGSWMPVIWGAAALCGYLVFMFFNPLRGYLGESFDLLSEKGHARLWGLVGVLSLPGMVWDWWHSVPAVDGALTVAMGGFHPLDQRPGGLELASGVLENIASVFSIVTGGTESGAGSDVRGGIVEIAGGALVVAVGLLVQFFLLLFIYLRIMMPGRELKISNLLDLAVRRIGTTWPILVACWLAWCPPLAFGFTGTAAAVWSIVFSAVFIVFAFAEVAVLAKNVPFSETVRLNFEGWRKSSGRAVWFFAASALHAVLLFFAAFILKTTVEAGTWLALILGTVFVFVRAYVMVWLLGAWVVVRVD